MNSKSSKSAKKLILTSLIIMIAVPIISMIVGEIAGAKAYNLGLMLFWFPILPFAIIIQIPCLIMSIKGTTLASKAKKAGEIKPRWTVLGALSIILASIWLIIILAVTIYFFRQ